jgi:hypothetical protein
MMAQEPFGHGAAADIARTDENDPRHSGASDDVSCARGARRSGSE